MTTINDIEVDTAPLVVTELTKKYGDTLALDRLSLRIEPGQILGLIGPNGAGKTTLISSVAGLRRPDSGKISVMGIDAIRFPKQAQRSIGMAPQDLAIYPTLSVLENLQFFARFNGVARRDVDRRVADLANTLDLAHLLD